MHTDFSALNLYPALAHHFRYWLVNAFSENPQAYARCQDFPEKSIHFSCPSVLRWQSGRIFEQIFTGIVRQCEEQHLVDGEHMVADGSDIPARVSRANWVDAEENIQFRMHSYLDNLDAELSEQAGYKEPPEKAMAHKKTTSTTDPECGYINYGTKRAQTGAFSIEDTKMGCFQCV